MRKPLRHKCSKRRESILDRAWLTVLDVFADVAIDNRKPLNPGGSPWKQN